MLSTIVAAAVAGLAIVGLQSAAPPPTITQMLGRPTFSRATVNVRADADLEFYVEYRRGETGYDATTPSQRAAAGEPVEFELTGLPADARVPYRVRYRPAGAGSAFEATPERSVQTQRAPGTTFSFGAQGDSHPERANNMFNADLYTRTLQAVAADRPDFYLTSGDDFSVDTLRTYTEPLVAERYTIQVPYLAQVAHSSPVFLVNGNHEQAARYLLDGTPNNVAVWAQNARNRLFPQPAPDGFYTGNTEVVPHIGLLRNYYAWEWGDALFVVIDPYWGSPVPVDNYLGGQDIKTTNKWDITHGDAQYQWLKRTLEESHARWKFVFAHHALGTGRGGVEVANDYEWGGRNTNGAWGFTANRAGWPLPIHQLMAANKVTIFFQGHDHLFAHQQLDGVTYQELPNPADNTYTAFNVDAYKIGETFPNAGYVKVTVSPASVLVEYIRMFLPKDERPPDRVSGMVQFSYTIPARP